MRVFVTGASGWIGSAAVDALLAAGHHVDAIARSDASATALAQKGVTVRRGDLDDLDGIRSGAESAEAVLHLANKHDWSNPAASNSAEHHAVKTIADALAGSGKPFLFASGVAALAQGRPSTEADSAPFHGIESPRGGAENLALEYSDRDVRVISLRFSPTVHGVGDHGFISQIASIARAKGVSGYPADGSNGWAAVHRSDAANMIVLGLEKAPTGSKLHAVAEPSVPTRDIAEAIGQSLGLPVASIAADDVADHFGWIGTFFAMNMSATSTATQEMLGWTPTGPTLLEDIAAGGYPGQ